MPLPSPFRALALVLPALASSICLAQCPGRYFPIPGANLTSQVDALLPLPDGHLIVAGLFYQTNPLRRSMAVWDGSNWSEFGGGANGGAVVSLLRLPDGDVVAGGNFTQIGSLTTSNIARWDGSSWFPLGDGLPHYAGSLLLLPNGDLLAAGSPSPVDPPSMISRWDGEAWTQFPTTNLGGYFDLALLANGVLVASSGRVADGRVIPAYELDGQAWRPLTGGATFLFGSCCLRINALLPMPNGDLIVGGDFDLQTDEGFVSYNLARWDGAQWRPMAEGLFGTVWDLGMMPNGEVIAAGQFWFSSLFDYCGIAKWDGSHWSPLLDAITGGYPRDAGALAVTPGGVVFSAPFQPTIIDRWAQPTADFDGDADVGTDADIAAFFACLAGDCCSMCIGPDFNGDGSPGTDADIEAFFRVLAGGPC